MDDDRLILSLSALAYEAGGGDGPWEAFGAALRVATGARSISLWAGRPREGEVDVLLTERLPDACRDAYARHWVRSDPWTGALASGARGIVLGNEVVADAALRESAFYRDFAREIGLFHLIGTVAALGQGVVMPLGLHRPEDGRPFGERERRVLEGVLPHLARAVRVQRRLAAGVAATVLEALPLPALVLDAALRVVVANAAALELARAGALPPIRQDGPQGPALLAPGSRLAALVRGVAAGTLPGAGMRWDGAEGGTALVLMPLPRRLAAGAARPGMARLLARRLAAAAMPPVALAQQVFGLTPAEAAVALALAAGESGPAVARRRRVSLATVRGQARTAMEKAGAGSLRELSVMLARLPGA